MLFWTYSTETDRVITFIATLHAISVARTTVDAIDFVSVTMVHSSFSTNETKYKCELNPGLRHSFMQLATLAIGQLAMHFMVSSAQMFSHFSARSMDLKILICIAESTEIRYVNVCLL